jgi:hypothetical protein
MSIAAGARAIARKIGIGKTVLKLHQQGQLGVAKTAELSRMKRKYLPLIVHMLLHQGALYEPCRLVIHSDGSLTCARVRLFWFRAPVLPNK